MFQVEEEMFKLRSQLRMKLKRRTFLRRMLGVSKVEAFLRNNFQQVSLTQGLSDTWVAT